QADPGRDEEREPAGRRQSDEVRALELGGRSRAWPEEALAAARLHPRVVVDEAQQSEREAPEGQSRQPGEAAPVRGMERVLDRLDRIGEHVPEEEDQDPGRRRAQKGFEALA